MLRKEELGQGLVEYALIIGLVVIVCVAALEAMGPSVTAGLNSIMDGF